jgi:hypothetical protein
MANHAEIDGEGSDDCSGQDYTHSVLVTMERRFLYVPVLHIDTNLIHAMQKLEAVNQL